MLFENYVLLCFETESMNKGNTYRESLYCPAVLLCLSLNATCFGKALANMTVLAFMSVYVIKYINKKSSYLCLYCLDKIVFDKWLFIDLILT